MWVSKRGDERKQELLDAALNLFAQRGYAKTSINDIIEAVGVTKGAFYHYFKAKDDILEEVVAKQTEAAEASLLRLFDDASLDALTKLKMAIAGMHRVRMDNKAEYSRLHRAFSGADNLELAHRLMEKSMARLTPTLASMIRQGVAEGVFHTEHPLEVAELLILLGSHFRSAHFHELFDDDAASASKVLQSKTAFLLESFERLLGAAPGSLHIELGGV